MVGKLSLLLLSVSFAQAGFNSGTIVTECGKSYIEIGGDYEAREDVQILAGEDILLKGSGFKAGKVIEFTAARVFKAAQLKVEATATTITASKIEIEEALFNGKTTLLGEATLSKVEVKGTLVVSGGCKAKHITATILTVTEDGVREIFLSGSSKIGGDIVFRGKPGIVHLSDDASVKGKVRNGKIEKFVGKAGIVPLSAGASVKG